jgi:mitogen-activated protein kinase 1/3
VWSCGCILAELIARKPFFPGEDYIHQLTMICDKLGKPQESQLGFLENVKARRFLGKLADKQPQPLSHYFPTGTPDALDLMSKMLAFNPNERITVEEALAHPYLAALANLEDEPSANFQFDFSFEDEELHKSRLQQLIWEEVGTFRPMCLPVPEAQEQTKKRSSRK